MVDGGEGVAELQTLIVGEGCSMMVGGGRGVA